MNASTSLPISFEFFPPRDQAGRERLVENVAAKLGALNPRYFSVTYGAGGSTKDGTQQTIAALLEAGHAAAPHLSLGSDGEDQILEMLRTFAELGVDRIVALRGDQPSGFGANRFAHNAESLVRLIREHFGDRFHLVVAAYPEVHPDSPSAAADIEFFKRKVDAGADSAVTQYFYNADAYENFLEHCTQAGITIPIVPGIMPITNMESLIRFSDKAGAEIPRWLQFELSQRQDDEADLIAFGVDVVTRMCERLIGLGAPAMHFYTLNRWGATSRICANLFG